MHVQHSDGSFYKPGPNGERNKGGPGVYAVVVYIPVEDVPLDGGQEPSLALVVYIPAEDVPLDGGQETFVACLHTWCSLPCALLTSEL